MSFVDHWSIVWQEVGWAPRCDESRTAYQTKTAPTPFQKFIVRWASCQSLILCSILYVDSEQSSLYWFLSSSWLSQTRVGSPTTILYKLQSFNLILKQSTYTTNILDNTILLTAAASPQLKWDSNTGASLSDVLLQHIDLFSLMYPPHCLGLIELSLSMALWAIHYVSIVLIKKRNSHYYWNEVEISGRPLGNFYVGANTLKLENDGLHAMESTAFDE